MGIWDWGFGIGPNPQSPIPNHHLKNNFFQINIIIIYIKKIIKIKNKTELNNNFLINTKNVKQQKINYRNRR
jgi:hypothetical protein